MWAEGRAYGYIRFKKIMPTENRGGWVVLPAPAMAPLPALLLLLLPIIATAGNKTRLYFVGRLRLLRLLSVRPAVGCMLCAGEPMHLLEQLAGSASSSLSLLFLIFNGFSFFILYFFFYNRAAINTQRIHAGYLRLLACVICPWGRGLIVRRVLCV